MIRKRAYENRVEVLQGTLDMLILKTLQWGPQHGYGIVQALRANSGEMLAGGPDPSVQSKPQRGCPRPLALGGTGDAH